MPREKQTYRDNLNMLMRSFPGVGAISVKEAAEYYGASVKTLMRDDTFPKDCHNRVSLANFARWLAV